MLRDFMLEPTPRTAMQEHVNALLDEYFCNKKKLIELESKMEEQAGFVDELRRELDELGYCV